MNTYMQLKDQVAGSYLKLKTLFGKDYSNVPYQAKSIDITSSGPGITLGSQWRVIRGVFRVKYTPDSGYASYAQLVTWMTASTAAGRTLSVIDHFGTTRTMFFSSDLTPEAATPVLDTAEAFYYVPFELLETY